ncbi:MAG: hypothetical protein ACREYE_27930 [Gammaproteobacteria bacterium]
MFAKETWVFLNTFADWVAAIGSISAVVVALYLARRDDQARLDIGAGLRMLVLGAGLTDEPEEVVTIRITNIGRRDVQVIGLGWRIGIFKRRYLEQATSFNPLDTPLPVRLRDGDEVFYRIPLTPTSLWIDKFVSTCVGELPVRRVRRLNTLRVRVYTSVGRVFEKHVEPGLQQRLLQHATRQSAA